ncbi:hypothetical protein WG66_010138 [Moniliophthora roreri]|nr:hypothetical protein WG66_010138 [Moniliophthora roreri]
MTVQASSNYHENRRELQLGTINRYYCLIFTHGKVEDFVPVVTALGSRQLIRWLGWEQSVRLLNGEQVIE